ncbi:dicarboxylate/amino acid:cation symporter [Helicobacter kayseriensis]|uniref:dicarboxylate/amino acid:cation symporter n=1 Tax=Helicobacter kayseriensis TaxID=2905877 RepID=UPI001E292569|nr:cation:dicarboxylase symporter family transporter [Helicobacter kayseriensis]MCE3047441.1 cation:dicarboxylase symporter family transporter [Helicobacter kayseriensis]MCE3048826.1 cation:dicarboxylase symporter family transporter [Helicobacter kayseriensis]
MTLFLQNFFLLSSWGTLLALCVLACIFLLLRQVRKYLSFSQRMFLGLLCGVGFGFGMQYFAGFPQKGVSELSNALIWYSQTYAWINFLSAIFVNFLKLIVVPIVLIGILYVILNLRSDIKLSSMFSRSLFWLLLTTGIASGIAVLLGTYYALGEGFLLDGSKEIREVQGLDQILLGLMPSNIIETMAKNAVVGVVIFAMIFALSIRSVGDEHPFYQSFVRCVDFLHQVMMKIAMLVIEFMPYAVVTMISGVLMRYGIEAVSPVLKFIALIYLSALCVFVVHAIVLSLHGLNPLLYFKKAIPALMMAFTSRSSVATLPVTIDVLEKRMGVSSMSSSFVATLATTIGANGCAGYFGGLVGVFAFHALGIEVGLVQGIMIVLLSMVASIGVAGIPGIATMVASIVLTGLGMGEHFGILAIVLAIDPIMDMARTMSNVSGGMIASIAVDKELGMLDEEKYKS